MLTTFSLEFVPLLVWHYFNSPTAMIMISYSWILKYKQISKGLPSPHFLLHLCSISLCVILKSPKISFMISFADDS